MPTGVGGQDDSLARKEILVALLREARDAAGLRQVDLAEKLGGPRASSARSRAESGASTWSSYARCAWR